ncbi:MAG TPA: transporter associated domain-containing protein, partial [Advenella sp.]|nr:transporter associated domain-containing protein [Advenella sp.]
ERGVCEGLLTPLDVLTAIGGELPEHIDAVSKAIPLPDGSWLLDPSMRIEDAGRALAHTGFLLDHTDATLTGCLLRIAGRIPDVGEIIEWQQWRFDITRRDGYRLAQVRAYRREASDSNGVVANQ